MPAPNAPKPTPQGGGQSAPGSERRSAPPFSLLSLLLSLFNPLAWFGLEKKAAPKPSPGTKPGPKPAHTGKRTVSAVETIASRAQLVSSRSYENILISNVRDGDEIIVRACIEARPDLGAGRMHVKWPTVDLSAEPPPLVKMEFGVSARVEGGILVDVENIEGADQLCSEPDAQGFPMALLPKSFDWIRLWHPAPKKPVYYSKGGSMGFELWSNIPSVGNLRPEIQLRVTNGNLVLRIGLAPWVVVGEVWAIHTGASGVDPSKPGFVAQLDALPHTVSWSATIDGGG